MVEDLHKLGIVHCDIKPDNILTQRVPLNKKANNSYEYHLTELILIDYGISATYLNSEGSHRIQYNKDNFEGNFLFTSRNQFMMISKLSLTHKSFLL
jgi:serine/threonine protein kinase